jgi:hypothetical protein
MGKDLIQAFARLTRGRNDVLSGMTIDGSHLM